MLENTLKKQPPLTESNADKDIKSIQSSSIAPKESESEVKNVEEKKEKPVVRVERTKIEYSGNKNQSRIEIVRKAPAKPIREEKSEGGSDRADKKPFNKQGGEKKLVERRIIPQEIYEGRGQSKKKADNKKKEKEYITEECSKKYEKSI